MKNRILSLMLSLSLLLSTFAGCSSTDTPKDNPDYTPTGTSSDAPETEPDYSWFKMPRETDTLTVYDDPFYYNVLQKAVSIFREKYPDVNVDFLRLGEDEFDTRIRAEIPAGKGPDVLFGAPVHLPDVYKTMYTGLFADLGGFMEKDEEFSPDDFYDGILKGGRMYGKQFILPLTMGIELFITTEELLDEIGIDRDTLGTWEGFYEAGVAFHEHYPEKPLLNYDNNQYYLTRLFHGCGFRLIDYENNCISFDETRFRQMIDLSRLYCYPKQPADVTPGLQAEGLAEGNCLFICEDSASLLLLASDYWDVRYRFKKTPVFVSIPNESGGVTARIINYAAIPEGSENKLNAWRFIKILLSPDLQGNIYQDTNPDWLPSNAYPVGLSVHKESLRSMLAEGELDEVADMMENVTDTILLPQILQKYISQYMLKYIKSADGTNYDKQFGQLMNALELYKDE